MNFHYQCITSPLPDAVQEVLIRLICKTLGDQPRAEVADDLAYQQARTPLIYWLAYEGSQLVGFKMGYERKTGHFYSWLGGVLPAYRGQGIASSLMVQQHDWCRANQYHTIRTHTYNQWRSMLILNLRHGFNVVGTQTAKRGLLIVLEKTLVTD